MINPDKKRERQRRYRENNPDKVREQQRLSREKNPDKLLERVRRYRENNPDKVRERQRRYRENNPDKLRERKRQTRLRNPDKYREYQRRYRANNLDQKRETSRRYYEKNRDKLRERKRTRLGSLKPTRPEPTQCECCGREATPGKALHLDHCHESGLFRGWLCQGCNNAAGLLGDNSMNVMRLVRYLQRAEAITHPQLPRPHANSQSCEI